MVNAYFKRKKKLFLRIVSNSLKQSGGCYPLETSTAIIMKQCYIKSQKKKKLYNYCYFNFQVSEFFSKTQYHGWYWWGLWKTLCNWLWNYLKYVLFLVVLLNLKLTVGTWNYQSCFHHYLPDAVKTNFNCIVKFCLGSTL